MFRILFVCLGNICRSSAAEEIMRQKLTSYELNGIVSVDSAGLIDYHEGELSDSRMRYHARQRGYILIHRSRPIAPSDFQKFDIIIGMDDSNMNRLRLLAPTTKTLQKVHKITEYSINYDVSSVPDPYYGGDSDFEYALDLLEDACEGLISEIKEKINK
jgi:protein-tyrosine phosphatase